MPLKKKGDLLSVCGSHHRLCRHCTYETKWVVVWWVYGGELRFLLLIYNCAPLSILTMADPNTAVPSNLVYRLTSVSGIAKQQWSCRGQRLLSRASVLGPAELSVCVAPTSAALVATICFLIGNISDVANLRGFPCCERALFFLVCLFLVIGNTSSHKKYKNRLFASKKTNKTPKAT